MVRTLAWHTRGFTNWQFMCAHRCAVMAEPTLPGESPWDLA